MGVIDWAYPAKHWSRAVKIGISISLLNRAECPTADGGTALMAAEYRGHTEIVEMLKKAGAKE